MPTRFAQQFKRTAVVNLLRQFGETIGYIKGGIGPQRSIEAIVVRDPVAVMQEVGEVITNAIIVRVANNNTTGIAATSLDSGRDKIYVALIADGEPSLRSIVKQLSDVNGFVRVLVQ